MSPYGNVLFVSIKKSDDLFLVRYPTMHVASVLLSAEYVAPAIVLPKTSHRENPCTTPVFGFDAAAEMLYATVDFSAIG